MVTGYGLPVTGYGLGADGCAAITQKVRNREFRTYLCCCVIFTQLREPLELQLREPQRLLPELRLRVELGVSEPPAQL